MNNTGVHKVHTRRYHSSVEWGLGAISTVGENAIQLLHGRGASSSSGSMVLTFCGPAFAMICTSRISCIYSGQMPLGFVAQVTVHQVVTAKSCRAKLWRTFELHTYFV